MIKDLLTVVVLVAIAGLYIAHSFNTWTPAPAPAVACTMEAKECPNGSYVGRIGPDCSFVPCPAASTSDTSGALQTEAPTTIKSSTVVTSTIATTQTALTQSDLLAMASDKYADGNVPFGDNMYVTSGPKTGYVYLCNVHTDNLGADTNGSWIHGNTWNYLDKTSVQGSVSWPQATFSNTVSGNTRTLIGNGLPVGFTTGTFPISPNDPAYQVDRNPNSISVQNFSTQISANPTYSATPYCTGGGEVGIMNDGIPLFNAFDAELRDAPAHEEQDSCDGHPNESDQYHYHSMSSCFKDISVSTVLGFALDGFPITGPEVAPNEYLTTDNLDECHGITSTINLDGKQVTTYHYVMTRDFPYSISCFRGKPVSVGPGAVGQSGTQQSSGQPSSGGWQGGPPAQAVDACMGKSTNASCSFITPQGDNISGTCQTPPNSSLACILTQ